MIYNKLPIDLQNKILSYYGESLKYKNPGLLYQIENLIFSLLKILSLTKIF